MAEEERVIPKNHRPPIIEDEVMANVPDPKKEPDNYNALVDKMLLTDLAQFTDEQIIDAIMKKRINTFTSRGGRANQKKNGWQENELKLRDTVVMDLLCRKCMPRNKVANQIAVRWDISPVTADRYISEAIHRFEGTYGADEEANRKLFLQSCSELLEEVKDKKKYDQIIKTLDLIGKSGGLYSTKQKVSLDGNITFTFGDEETKPAQKDKDDDMDEE